MSKMNRLAGFLLPVAAALYASETNFLGHPQDQEEQKPPATAEDIKEKEEAIALKKGAKKYYTYYNGEWFYEIALNKNNALRKLSKKIPNLTIDKIEP